MSVLCEMYLRVTNIFYTKTQFTGDTITRRHISHGTLITKTRRHNSSRTQFTQCEKVQDDGRTDGKRILLNYEILGFSVTPTLWFSAATPASKTYRHI